MVREKLLLGDNDTLKLNIIERQLITLKAAIKYNGRKLIIGPPHNKPVLMLTFCNPAYAVKTAIITVMMCKKTIAVILGIN